MRRRRGRSSESPVAWNSRSEVGFTLVEVLVIMLIMGIIAGLAVPSFLGQRTRADDGSSKAAARAAAAAMESYASDNLGSYQGVSGTILNSMDSAVPSETDAQGFANCSTGAPDNLPLCWVVTTPPNSKTGTSFTLTKRYDGQILSACSQHGQGGCPSDGHWGTD
jgi:type IV pilus assembly protein PilA